MNLFHFQGILILLQPVISSRATILLKTSMLRFPDIMTTAQDDGKVVSLRHRPPLLAGNAPGTRFC